jgi:DNA (cytosine-5)-methyltransferase 1
MYGLDLFSGIGGITKALAGYVRPVAYCEIEPYARRVLLSRMHTGDIPLAPIWDDVSTLRGAMLPHIDIIYGGFPCQDISVAGKQIGLGGKRSGLFSEICRLAEETKAEWIFLENVPNIRTKGLGTVLQTLAEIGYDTRYGMLSAADVGANHKRERWFLLAHSRRALLEGSLERRTIPVEIKNQNADKLERPDQMVDAKGVRLEVVKDAGRESTGVGQVQGPTVESPGTGPEVANPDNQGLQGRNSGELQERSAERAFGSSGPLDGRDTGWWVTEPNVGRVANGVPKRVDRLRALGNSVVPAQAREAFERLMGLK